MLSPFSLLSPPGVPGAGGNPPGLSQKADSQSALNSAGSVYTINSGNSDGSALIGGLGLSQNKIFIIGAFALVALLVWKGRI